VILRGAIHWLSVNRLKVESGLAIAGDTLMGTAGGVSYFSTGNLHSLYGMLLMCGGILGVLGHGGLIVWGKGARENNIVSLHYKKITPIYIKPLQPSRYPLDFAFVLWIFGSSCYLAAGFVASNVGMVALGLFTLPAAIIGWLWPQEKLLLGFRSLQITAILYGLSSVSGLFAALIARDIILLTAIMMYVIGNFIMFTVRKENQSTFTQANEG